MKGLHKQRVAWLAAMQTHTALIVPPDPVLLKMDLARRRRRKWGRTDCSDPDLATTWCNQRHGNQQRGGCNASVWSHFMRGQEDVRCHSYPSLHLLRLLITSWLKRCQLAKSGGVVLVPQSSLCHSFIRNLWRNWRVPEVSLTEIYMVPQHLCISFVERRIQ